MGTVWRSSLSSLAKDGRPPPPGIDPEVKKSWLAVFEFRDGAFVMGKLGPELTVPMQGLGFDRSRLLLITPESHSFSFFRESTAASHLLALSLR